MIQDTRLDVLVVDDDDLVRGAVADALAEEGHRVWEARDGETALFLADSHVFSLVVTDVRMPRLDGLTLFRRVRIRSPDTDIVLMTSFAKIDDVVRTMRAGAADFITKPFDAEAFARDVVGRIAARRAVTLRPEPHAY